MNQPNVLAIGTAVPGYCLSQTEIKEFAAALFQNRVSHIERLLPVFDNACINRRYLAKPLEWYRQAHSFAEANAEYAAEALRLAEAAAAEAIDRSGIAVEEIGALVFVSSTGITTPTLDARLIQRLGLSPHTVRVPVWGLGCAGGVAGMARAAELHNGGNYAAVLLIAVELCSLTFQREDFSKSNLVGSGIFADGAAAAVLAARGEGPEILNACSMLFPDSEDVMGWDLIDSGLKVRFSRDIPSMIRDRLPGLLAHACRLWRIEADEVVHFVVHPGGAKVLAAYADSLNIDASNLKYGYDVLADYGNMSSCSVLFVLNSFLHAVPPSGDYGVLLALGPGFSAEMVLFRW
ncbi:MAG: 3-oxoacyl-[acyl-carrier-protein] synthase III C-terminal domain-containing protein [Sporomusaceae bacterium]|nr:3-oxoacyl-[acyl-carrier-protein] synthase III C-terminal domain-containing protein [Sporomusaceae bacterium]